MEFGKWWVLMSPGYSRHPAQISSVWYLRPSQLSLLTETERNDRISLLPLFPSFVLPWAWCDGNMVPLLFSGWEHGQSWPASASLCCKHPQSKPKHKCGCLAIFMMRNQQPGAPLRLYHFPCSGP